MKKNKISVLKLITSISIYFIGQNPAGKIRRLYRGNKTVKSAKVLSFILIITITSCISGKITTNRDTFKDATVISMKLVQHSKERPRPLASPYKMISEYVREVKDKGLQRIMLYILIKHVPVTNNILSEEIIFKLDEVKFPLLLKDRRVHSYESEKFQITGFSQAHNFRDLSGNVEIPLDLVEKIKSSEKMMIRIYDNRKPVTFNIQQKHLEKIKMFLNYKKN